MTVPRHIKLRRRRMLPPVPTQWYTDLLGGLFLVTGALTFVAWLALVCWGLAGLTIWMLGLGR